MVNELASEDEIRAAFFRVKADITSLKRSLSQAQQEFISKSPEKREFYDFIKAVDSRLRRIELSVEKAKDFEGSHKKEHNKQLALAEESLAELKNELRKADSKRSELEKELNAGLQKAEDNRLGMSDEFASDLERADAKRIELESEIKALKKPLEKVSSVEAKLKDVSSEKKQVSADIEKLREKVSKLSEQLSSLEGRIESMPDFSKLSKKIDAVEEKFSEARKLVKEADISELKLELSELTRDFSKLGSRFVAWNDLSKSGKKLEQEMVLVNERINNLILSMDSLKDGFVSKDDASKASEELKSLKKSVEEILDSEVDLEEYATRSELKELLGSQKKEFSSKEKSYIESAEEAYNEKIRGAISKIDDISSSLEILSTRAERAIAELSDRVSSLEKSAPPEHRELKRLRDDIDYVKANLVTPVDVERAVSGLKIGREAPSKFENAQTANEYTEYQEKTGIATYIGVFIIITLLVLAGYYIYTQVQFVQTSNMSSNASNQSAIIIPIIKNQTTNASLQNVTPAKQNISNLTPEQVQANMDNECILKFECTNDSQGLYNFNCYFDSSSSACRCYKGDAADCNETRIAYFDAARKEAAAKSVSPGASSSTLSRYWLYIIAAASLVIFVMLLVYLFKKGEEAAMEEEKENGSKEKKDEPAREPKESNGVKSSRKKRKV